MGMVNLISFPYAPEAPLRRLLLPALACWAFLACGTSTPNLKLPPPQPVITAFRCTPSITSGTSGAIIWGVAGATTVTIAPGPGAVTASPVAVSPTQTTTYTLTATNAGGTVTASCTMTVFPASTGGLSLLAATPAAGVVNGSWLLSGFDGPGGVAVDPSGNLYVADTGDAMIRRCSAATGLVTSFLTGLLDGEPAGLATDGSGNVYFPSGADLMKVAPGGSPALFANLGALASGAAPRGLAFDGAGNLYAADPGSSAVYVVTPQGAASLLAGTPGQIGYWDDQAYAALFDHPTGLAVDAAFNVYVVDAGNSAIRIISQAGLVGTLVPGAALDGGIAVGQDGTLFAGSAGAIVTVGADGTLTPFAGKAGVPGYLDGAGTAARFAAIDAMAVDRSGNLVVADGPNDVIRTVTPGGVVTTLAGRPQGQPPLNPGLAVDGAGNVFVPGADDTLLEIGAGGASTVLAGAAGLAGAKDGQGGAARFGLPAGVALDPATGDLYVTDAASSTLRMIAPDGTVTTPYGLAGVPGGQSAQGQAARFRNPSGLARDGAGNLYVADTGNATIRKISATGLVSTLAGSTQVPGTADGAGTAARFDQPCGIVVDGTGTVFVADSGNAAIRRITPQGVVSTLVLTMAGTGASGAGLFKSPQGLALDGQGNLIVSDAQVEGLWQITQDGVVSPVPVAADSGYALLGAGLAYAGGTLYLSLPGNLLLLTYN